MGSLDLPISRLLVECLNQLGHTSKYEYERKIKVLKINFIVPFKSFFNSLVKTSFNFLFKSLTV